MLIRLSRIQLIPDIFKQGELLYFQSMKVIFLVYGESLENYYAG